MKFEIEQEKSKKQKEQDKEQKFMMIACVFFAVLSILLMIIYFATRNNTKKTQTTNTQTVQEPTVKKTKIEIVDEKSNERPIAVVIDNNLGSVKHAGLQDSYINYETLAEDDKTKILAIFKDTEVGVIGPIDIVNHYYIDYALEHNAVLASYGATSYAEKLITSDSINYIGKQDSSAYMRDRKLTSPHDVFTSTKRIKAMMDEKNYQTTTASWKVLKYSVEDIDLKDAKTSQKATNIYMNYSSKENRQYTYDSNNKYYLRYNNESPDIDRKSREQLHYKNIIITYADSTILPKENIIDVTTVGNGQGYYITNGYAVTIKWSKESQTSKTKYTYTDGTELKVNDGNTFIQIVPTNGDVRIK